jgi:ATP-dependent exoDNAse (exonuclease V) alpha subunit
MVVQWDDGRKVTLSNKQAQAVDHAYARTTFKEQGATNTHEVIMVSERGAKIFNKEAAYVAATRAKVNTEVITSDRDRLLKNAGVDVSKETALQQSEMKVLVEQARSQQAQNKAPQLQERPVQKPQKIQELTRD